MKRRYFVPEVVQSSGMDCGPAALKSLLAGYGIDANYGRLREACQTDVDGTSIDTLEEVLVQLGLDAEQEMLPADFLFESNEELPMLVVTLEPGGSLHFVVVWRIHGHLAQVMDPAKGRRWIRTSRLREELFRHEMEVEAEDWEEWARSPEFLVALGNAMQSAGITRTDARELIDDALAQGSWRSLATLDAAIRMTRAFVRAGATKGSSETKAFVQTLLARSEAKPATTIPERYWSAYPQGDEGEVRIRGAVVVRIRGTRAPVADEEEASDQGPLSEELERALKEPPLHPFRALWKVLREDGNLPLSVFASALAIAACLVVVEALLFRGLFDMGRELVTADQRLVGGALLLVFLAGVAVLEYATLDGLLRMGRRLEMRLRVALRHKVAAQSTQYFSSRLTSDMAQRAHSVGRLQGLPWSAGMALREFFQIAFTTIGLVWLSPGTMGIALVAAAASILLPALATPALLERDLRARSHVGALSRFYLDSLLGLVAVRSHGAERAMRLEHGLLLDEWVVASLRYQRSAVLLEGAQLALGLGLAAWLLVGHIHSVGTPGALLMAYWALQLPSRGNSLVVEVLRIPGLRNVALRLYELLESPDEDAARSSVPDAAIAQAAPGEGVHLSLQNISVVAGGHTILDSVSLEIPAGAHVAIVGRSGAGKSTLAGLALGTHSPSGGQMQVNGLPLEGKHRQALREKTAWVDPAVHLWNRSLLENLAYGNDSGAETSISAILDTADLRGLLQTLPDGLQETLGEGGCMLSGGEGQRVRLGRAAAREDASLAVLDEAFRGLDRTTRTRLLANARQLYARATMLCITHDIEVARDFDLVVVMDEGRIAEAGAPSEIENNSESLFAQLLAAERENSATLWNAHSWKKLRLEDGRLCQSDG